MLLSLLFSFPLLSSRRDRWSVGEVARVQSNLIPFSSPTLEIFNYTTNERETISRDSSRIMPPMTMSAMPAATPPPAATSRAAPVTHATTSTTSRARAGNGNTVAVSPASVTAPPTVATTPASNLSSAAHAPTTPAAHSSSAVPVSASTTAAAPAVQPVPAEPVPVPVSPLGVADPTLISGHGYTLDHGDSCDCLDTEQKWRLAEITAVEPTHVLVHYVHWSPKWDEWIPRSDRRLQPPRTKTEGYTGPINKNPAVVRPPVAPQPPPRPSYTCLAACSWKRVLSTGLSHKEIQALNELFAQCAYVQDSYEEVLMGKLGAAPATPPSAYAGYNTWQPPSAPVFRHTLDTVTALLGKLDESIASATATLPPLCHFPITQCASMAANIRGLILDAEETRRRQLLAAQEDAYMSKLNRQFRIVDISADGSCLFSAVGIGAKIKRAVGATNEEKKASGVEEKPVAEAGSVETTQQQEADAKVVSHSAPTPDAATPDPLIVLSLLRDASDLKLQHAVSSECRSDVIAFLRARLSPSDVASSDASAWSKKIATEVREVVVQESAGKYSDATSKAVWEELKGPAAAAGVPSPLALADTNDAIEAYLKVMATDGIYGTSLEVDALSDMLRTPIHLFYRSESDSSQSSVAAAESGITAEQVVGAQYPGPPICLAYYMGNKHYNLLVDRAHIPKPPPKPTATIPQTDEKAVKPATEHETRAAEEPAPGEEGHPMSDDSSMTVTIIHEDAPGSVPMVTTIGADDSEGSASSTAPTSGPQPMDTHEDGAIDDLPASPPPVVHEDVSAPAVPPALQVDSHASPHVAQSAPPTPKIEASVTMSRAALASRSATNSPKGAKKTLAANTTASGGLDALAPHAPATSTTQTPTSHTTLTTPRIPSASSVGVPTPSSSASASPPASTPAGSGAVISLWVNMPGLPKQSVSIPLHRPLNELTAHLSLRSKESATFFQSIAGSWEQLDARLTPHELGLTEKQHIGVQPATTTHTTR